MCCRRENMSSYTRIVYDDICRIGLYVLRFHPTICSLANIGPPFSLSIFKRKMQKWLPAMADGAQLSHTVLLSLELMAGFSNCFLFSSRYVSYFPTKRENETRAKAANELRHLHCCVSLPDSTSFDFLPSGHKTFWSRVMTSHLFYTWNHVSWWTPRCHQERQSLKLGQTKSISSGNRSESFTVFLNFIFLCFWSLQFICATCGIGNGVRHAVDQRTVDRRVARHPFGQRERAIARRHAVVVSVRLGSRNRQRTVQPGMYSIFRFFAHPVNR